MLSFIDARMVVWVIAQQHLYFAAFVLAVPMFAVIVECVGVATRNVKYDQMAKEFTKLLMLAFSTTAVFGAILLFLLIGLYPTFTGYLTETFSTTMYLYAFLFFGEGFSLYMYYYSWDWLINRKALHVSFGVALNVFGTALMFIANAWVTFMMSPTGVDMETGALLNLREAIENPLWWPINVHRLIANLAFGGSIAAAYAAFKFLGAKTAEERAHYDWMGYIGNFIAICALLVLPFAGYWLGMEIYGYSAQMGTTLMGGALSWLWIIQAILIGVLFISANYYLWIGLGRIPGGSRYTKYIIYMEVLLFACLAIWMTPHTLVATLIEARKIGAAYHPLLGVFGVMSAKNTVVNMIILTTFISFLLYRRANKQATVRWANVGTTVQGSIFAVTAAIAIYYGVKGYFVAADVRIGYSVYQVLSVLTCIILVVVIDIFLFVRAKTLGLIRWGEMPDRSQYALFLLAITFTLLMGLMGFARSAARMDWHVYGVMRDVTPHAFTPTLGYATVLIFAGTVIFFSLISFVFWMGALGERKADPEKRKTDPEK